jgi:Tfp pilus assembly protein PilF
MTYLINSNNKNPNPISKKPKTQRINIASNSSSSDVEKSLNDKYDKPVKEIKKVKKVKKVKKSTEKKEVKVQPQQASTKPIDNANKYLNAQNFDMSADELRKVDKTKLTVEEKQKYQQAAEKIYAATGPQNQEKGRQLYQAGKYKEAIPYLERYALAEKKDAYRAWVLYYLAKSYQKIGNTQKSNEYVYKIKSEYPNSQQAGLTDNNNW